MQSNPLKRSPSRNFKDAAKYRVLRTFRDFDADGSGSISAEELTLALANIGLSEATAAEIITKVDTNHDGSISYTEFTSWVFGKAVRDLPTGAEKLLWAADAQKDIFKAVRRGEADNISMMLQRDNLVSLDATEEDGCSLLMAAAQRGQLDAFRRLLDLKCSLLNAVDDKGKTALDHARASGNPKILEYMLVQHTASDNTVVPFVGALLPALERSDVEGVRQSVRPRVVFQVYIDRHEGDLMGLEFIPSGKAELVVKGIVPGLIDNWNNKRPDLRVKPEDHLVQVNESSGDFKQLKRELATCQEMVITLHRYSNDEGFDPNVRNEYGASALHLAVRSGKLALVEALASSQDVMPNEKDRFGRTAMDIAKELKFEDIEAYLKSSLFAKASSELKISPHRRAPGSEALLPSSQSVQDVDAAAVDKNPQDDSSKPVET